MPLREPYPDLISLGLLVTVGELGSIRAAAAAHGVTQPAASMRLRALERTLQISLLERATTGTQLTPAGMATAELAATVLNGVQTLLATTAALRADRKSHLRLAGSLTVSEYLIPAWLQRFGAESPDTQVSLQMGNTSHVIDLVTRGEVDLGFIEGARPPSHLRFKELIDDELVIVVSPTHPWSRRRRPISPRQLATTPLVLRERGSGTREVLINALKAHGLGVTTAMELGSTTAIKAAASSGAGPAVVSMLGVWAEVQAGQLVPVACEDLLLTRSIRVIWAAARPPSASSARLMAIAGLPTPERGTYKV